MGVSHCLFFIVDNVEIQKSVTIQICKCHRVGSSALTQSALSLLNKPPFTVIQKEGIAIAQRRDQQVEISSPSTPAQTAPVAFRPSRAAPRSFLPSSTQSPPT